MFAAWYTPILQVFWIVFGILLILIVLIQKGKGAGLSGAFGGAGGHGALGTKAADVMVRVTSWIAGIWIVLTMILVLVMNPRGGDTEFKKAGDVSTPTSGSQGGAGSGGSGGAE